MPLSDKKQDAAISAIILLSWWIVPRHLPALTFLVLLLGSCWWLGLLLKRMGAQRPLQQLIWWALGIRGVAALFLYLSSLHGWPVFTQFQHAEQPGFWYFARDALGGHRYAFQIFSAWTQGTPYPIFTSGAIEYYLWLAGIYWLFGPHPLHGILVNIVLGVLQVILAFAITRKLSNEKNALRAGWLVALWPSNILWSTQLLKDTLCNTIVLLVLAASVHLWKSTRTKTVSAAWWILLMVGIAAILKLRSYVGISLVLAALISFGISALRILGRKEFWMFRHAATIAVVCGITAMLSLKLPFPQRWFTTHPPTEKSAEPTPMKKPAEPTLMEKPTEPTPMKKPAEPTLMEKPTEPTPMKKPAEPTLMEKPTGLTLHEQFLEYMRLGRTSTVDFFRSFSSSHGNGGALSLSYLNNTRKGILSAGGDSTIDKKAVFNSPLDALLFIPEALAATWLSPSPQQWFETQSNSGIFRLFGGGETILIYPLLFFFFLGSVRVLRYNPADGGMLLCFIGLLSLVLGFCVPNVGTIFRLRLGLILPSLIVAAIGFEKEPGTRSILRVITRLNIGGPAHQAVLLSHTLNHDKWKTLLVIGKPDPTEAEASDLLDRYPCRWIKLPHLRRSLHPIRDLVAGWQLLLILWREKPAILHTHTAKAGSLGRSAGLLYRWTTRRPLTMIHTFHGHIFEGYFHPLASRFFCAIERWLACRTDCLIAVSAAVKQDLLAHGIGPASKIRVVQLGLNLDPLFSIQNHALPTDSSIRIGVIGRLVPIKNHALFFQAIHRLISQGAVSELEVMVVGDGELRPWLEALCQSLGIDRWVRFTGWQRDLRSVYAGVDLICLTSRNEGTPVSLIEALAAAKPVIATNVGGVRDVVSATGLQATPNPHNGRFQICEHGLLVPPDDPEGLAEALLFLIHQPSMRLQMGQAGRAFVRDRFSFHRLVRDLEDLYDASLVRNGAGSTP